MMNQCSLPLKMLIVRIFLQLFQKCPVQSLFHLGSCSSGERHHQQLIHIQRMFPLTDQLQDTFYQNGGFSRSSRRTHENISLS